MRSGLVPDGTGLVAQGSALVPEGAGKEVVEVHVEPLDQKAELAGQ